LKAERLKEKIVISIFNQGLCDGMNQSVEKELSEKYKTKN